MQSSKESDAQIVVIGYGNTFRRDDGAGVALATKLAEAWQSSGQPVYLVTEHQLVPEMAAELASDAYDAIVFVDAAADAAASSHLACVQVSEITIDSSPATMGHHFDPPTLLLYIALLYDRHPRAWMVTVPGVDFDHGEGYSPSVAAILGNVTALASELLSTIKETIPCMN